MYHSFTCYFFLGCLGKFLHDWHMSLMLGWGLVLIIDLLTAMKSKFNGHLHAQHELQGSAINLFSEYSVCVTTCTCRNFTSSIPLYNYMLLEKVKNVCVCADIDSYVIRFILTYVYVYCCSCCQTPP
jgi:hypothetical protein